MVTIKKIIAYVTHTPYNTNKAILFEKLRELIICYGGRIDENGNPQPWPDAIVYDGGIEK